MNIKILLLSSDNSVQRMVGFFIHPTIISWLKEFESYVSIVVFVIDIYSV
jgi:hypothetical protein